MLRLALTTCCLTFALCLSFPAAANAAVIGGTIDSVSDDKIVLKIRSTGKTQVFQIPATARITLDGKPNKLATLKPGMKISVTTRPGGQVSKISASSETDAPPESKPEPEPKPKPEAKPTPRKPALRNEPAAAAGDWPQFRGPNRDNVSDETGLLKTWPDAGPQLLWTARGFGEGYSAVSISAGRIYTLGTQGNNQAAFARDLETGEEVWTVACGPAFREGAGNGPRSTPTVDGDAVYVLGGGGELSRLEVKSGQVAWQKNILQEFGGNNITWGICESVLIDGERLICTPGGRGATLVALDKGNGEVVWKSAVPGNPQASYASPIAVTVGGVKQYVAFTSQGVVGVRAADGEPLWGDNASSNDTANCSTPLFYDNHIFSASGYGQGGALVRLTSARNSTTAQVRFKTQDMKNHHGGMVIVDGYLYGSNDPGILTCIDLRDGKVKWQNRSAGKGSVTYADGRIYLRSEEGPLALVEATPAAYREQGRFPQPDRSNRPAWAHPVVAAGKLFLRDQDLLLCYDVKEE